MFELHASSQTSKLALGNPQGPCVHASCCSAPFLITFLCHVCRKKFLIENLEGTKVVSRKKGFTTTTCVSGVAIGQQTKRFEALPESAKVSCSVRGSLSVFLMLLP